VYELEKFDGSIFGQLTINCTSKNDYLVLEVCYNKAGIRRIRQYIKCCIGSLTIPNIKITFGACIFSNLGRISMVRAILIMRHGVEIQMPTSYDVMIGTGTKTSELRESAYRKVVSKQNSRHDIDAICLANPISLMGC